MSSFGMDTQYKPELTGSSSMQPKKHYLNLDLILDFDYLDDEDYKDYLDDDYLDCESRDYYSPEEIDGRLFQSGIEDIDYGDNFADYARYFFNTYGEDLFDN